ncbi:MAG: phosphate ABC transporter permease subunit PstC [Alphaproteobacteria bacterium]|nr:phosphate ABC transporter permease subunit PstC [Alphaproteobacteria bacterium SS10]
MSATILIAILLIIAAFAYQTGRQRAFAVAGNKRSVLHSLPVYHGSFMLVWVLLPAIAVLGIWTAIQSTVVDFLVLDQLGPAYADLSLSDRNITLAEIHNLASGDFNMDQAAPEIAAAAELHNHLSALGRWLSTAVVLGLAAAGFTLARRQIGTRFRARQQVERVVDVLMLACSVIAILTTIGIVLSLLFEALRFFVRVPFYEFLFGLQWSPQTALRADQVGSSGAFGAIPLFAGTLLISFIAMMVAVPIGLFAAIYMAEFADRRTRSIAKPVLEVLAGVPTVVYGFFAALTVAPVFRGWGDAVGLDVSSESALAAGMVMGIMIIPFVSSLSDDVINAVPQSLRDGAYGLGATKAETVTQIILPAALPGIVGAILLAVSRAIGETMIVVMAAGLAANLTANPLEAVTTVTVQITTLLVGDQEFDSAKTLSVFALGLVLFIVTLCLNVVALKIVQKYRERYE